MTVKQCQVPLTYLESHPELVGYWIVPDGTLLIDSEGDFVDPEHIYCRYEYGFSAQLCEGYSRRQNRPLYQHQPLHDLRRSSLRQQQHPPRPCLPRWPPPHRQTLQHELSLAEAGSQIAGHAMTKTHICFDDFCGNHVMEVVSDSSPTPIFVKNSKNIMFYIRIGEEYLLGNLQAK